MSDIKTKLNEIKNKLEGFIAEVNVNELKESLNSMLKDTQKDFTKLVDKDLGQLKVKFNKEKAILEKKAKKFYDNHKKEIDGLQAKFDKLVKKNAATIEKKVPAAKKAVTKDISKKVSKVTKKIAKKTAKKTTKK